MIHLLRIAVGSVIVTIVGLLVALTIYLSKFENIVELTWYACVGILIFIVVYSVGAITIAEFKGDI